MRQNALPMFEDSLARVPELLQAQGITVEPHRDINQFRMLKCSRDGVVALVAASKPAHWAVAADQRRQMVVVAVLGESLFRLWRIPRENRFCRDIVEILRSLEWHPNTPIE